MNQYTAGTPVTVTTAPSGFVSTTTNEPFDPASVVLKVSVRRGTPMVYTYGSGSTLLRSGVGIYYATLSTTAQPGTWACEIIGYDGNGNSEAIFVDYFYVIPASS